MWEHIDVWGFLSGLGLFLLGMFMLEQGLGGLASRALKRFLREQTRSPIRGVVTGTVATFILQSSSLVGLIMLAFVGAGILELRNALGVILGANLGTTFKGWLVAAIGFTFELDAFAEPLLAAGAMGTVFLPRDRRAYFWSNFVLGLGLLLLGLDAMKGAFDELAANVDVSILQGRHPFTYLVAGTLFTAVVQSSSATMMILLAALHAGIIDLPAAAALAIGADLGTTSTVMLGAVRGSADKRRVALSHFLFNVATDLVAFLLLPMLLHVVTDVARIHDPLYALVAFHSLFNILGIIIFVPIVEPFVRMLEGLVREDPRRTLCRYIQHVPPAVTDAAIEAVRKELRGLVVRGMCFNLSVMGVRPSVILGGLTFLELPAGAETVPDYPDGYDSLKNMTGEILAYTYAVQGAPIEPADAGEITRLNHAVRNIGYSTKYIKDIRHNLEDFADSHKEVIHREAGTFRERIADCYSRLGRLLAPQTDVGSSAEFLDIRAAWRSAYEASIARTLSSTGAAIGGMETSDLLNANRALYRSTVALMEAVRVLLRLDEEVVEQLPEAAPEDGARDATVG
jgi:phosphate:Na+ symporter